MILPRVLLVLPLAALVGCSGIRIDTDYDPAADFSTLKTWAWVPASARRGGDPRIVNDLVDARIRAAVEAGLASRGYRKVSSGSDFVVTYHAGLERKIQVDRLYGSGGYYPYRDWHYYGGGETVVREYDEGTLLLDVIDAKQKTLVWRGSARAVVDEAATPEQREAKIRAAVEKMLDRFPPQGPKKS